MTTPTGTGSISLSGLLGGTAGQIDTTTLISQLMAAQEVPQNELKDQLTTTTNQLMAYQAINTKLTAVQTAAQALTGATAWQATAATSSSSAVVATSSATASPGSTTFSVTALARAQVTTVAADSSGTVVSVPSAGIRVTDSSGNVHNIALTSGTAADVAAAINAANIGVRASAVQTTQGVVLQVSSTKTGAANGFSLAGFDSTPTNLSTAADAQVTVGDPSAGGYTVNSSTNTFTSLIPGVTFSANALADDVTVTVASDESSISNSVSALVSAAAAAATEVSGDTAQGAILQGHGEVNSLVSALSYAVSKGTATGGSLKTYGIDLDSSGKLSFDATAFATAYAADPTGTQAAVNSFAASLNSTATSAVDPTTGTITAAINSATDHTTQLNQEIDDWTTRLTSIQANLQTKYAAMETALARLQSQQTYLTSMFNSMNNSSSSSSSSSSS
jgi:flagellar hook-associated protein 2